MRPPGILVGVTHIESICQRPTGEPLIGDIVRLDPMSADDAAGLHAIMSDPRAFGGGWPFERAHTSPEETAAFVRARLAADSVVYTLRVVHPGFGEPGAICGTTSLSEIDVANEKVHLGGTFYGRAYWGSGVNAQAKLLVLSHVFDDCAFGRVKIQTDIANTRSRAAITRLGAQFEGVLRRDVRRTDGSWRDTVVYSILRADWPVCRAALTERVRAALSR